MRHLGWCQPRRDKSWKKHSPSGGDERKQFAEPEALEGRTHTGRDGQRRSQEPKLVFATEILADVEVVDCSSALRRWSWLLHEEIDGDTGSSSGVEDLPTFPPRHLTSRPLISAEVDDMYVVELLGEGNIRGGAGVARCTT